PRFDAPADFTQLPACHFIDHFDGLLRVCEVGVDGPLFVKLLPLPAWPQRASAAGGEVTFINQVLDDPVIGGSGDKRLARWRREQLICGGGDDLAEAGL